MDAFLESFEYLLEYVFDAKQKRSYFKIESTFRNMPDIKGCTKILDTYVEEHNLPQLRMMVGVYLVNQGIFTEDLIMQLDNQSKISHLDGSATEEEKVFEQCVYWRNEFVRWFFREQAVDAEWDICAY